MEDKLIFAGRTKTGKIRLKGFRKAFSTMKQTVKGKEKEYMFFNPPSLMGQGWFVEVSKKYRQEK